MKKVLLLVALTLTISGLSGCASLQNRQKKETEISDKRISDQNALSIKHVVESSDPAPVNVTVSGSSNVITMPPQVVPASPRQSTTEVGVTGDSNVSAKYSDTWSMKAVLPWSIAALFFAVAALLGLLALWIVRKQYAAADAVIGLADSSIGQVANSVKNYMATSNDSGVKLMLASINSEVEKQRGIVNAHDPRNP